MVTMDKQWCTFNVLRLSTTYNGYKTSKYASNFKIPYYHPLNLWLLWAMHTPSAYPLRIPPPCTPSVYPLRIPPLCTPSMYPLHVPPPHTPSVYPLHVPEWIWLVNVPTTANQITGIEKANYHKILIFFPHHLFEKSTCSQNRSISWL